MILAHLFLGKSISSPGGISEAGWENLPGGAALVEAGVGGIGRQGPQEGLGGPGG